MATADDRTITEGATVDQRAEQGDTIAELDEDAESSHGTVDAHILQREEHRRRVGALKALLSSYCITSLVLIALSTERPVFKPLVALTLINAAFAAALLFIARKRRYPDFVSAGIGVSGALVALAGGVYFGIGSGTVVGLPVLVYYYGGGDSKLRRRVVLGFILVGYLLLTALTLSGVVPARGLVFDGYVSPRLELLGAAAMAIIVLQIVLLTYWLARKSRRSTLLAMAALERARLSIRQRDALLQEANANLDRVMGAAHAGRYTGQVVGSFEVGDVIGRGAIGEVYEARHRQTQQAVALKVLHSHLQHESGHLQRFFREVQIASSLRSVHIPHIIESGSTSDGGPFLAMELLRGTDLATELRRRKRLPLTEIDELVEQLSSALEVAHASGVVHRDIKPQNLFRVQAPATVWKVLDFGVSKLVSIGGTLTGGAAVGTPAYMAPEQVSGEDVDARADVFALAAVVYRALTGRPAFSGPSDLATMLRVTRLQPWRPGELSSVHPNVDAWFALALAKDPARRFASARALSDAWKAARNGALDPGLAQAAERVLAEHPWGSDLEPDSATTPLPAASPA